MRAVLCLCVLTALVLAAPAAVVQRVSVNAAGEEGDRCSGYPGLGPWITPDGRYVSFTSAATNLVPDDTNGVGDESNGLDVFVRDRATGGIERVSVSASGAQLWRPSGGGAISRDGRFVVFGSGDPGVVPGDANGWPDVFVRDRLLGTTELLGVSTSGKQADQQSTGGEISGDGRFVVFESGADNLVPGVLIPNQVYLRDRLLARTEVMSISSAGVPGDAGGWGATMSPDGLFIVFGSDSTNLVPNDTNGWHDGFVHDRLTGDTERVDVSSSGEQANERGTAAAITMDGRYVVVGGLASNLVPGDTNGMQDWFVRDRWEGVTERISVSSAGEEGHFSGTVDQCAGEVAGITLDGRYVVFSTALSGLVPDDTNELEDAFIRDRTAGTTTLLSRSRDGKPAGGSVGRMRGDPRQFIAFWSASGELVPGDTNGTADVFVWDRDARFHDVPSVFWAFGDIEACVASGLVQGYPENTYHPERTVTRDQMAVYIARALALPTGDAGVPDGPAAATFADVPNTGCGASGTEPYWAYKYIEYCVSRGVVKGYDATHYQPLVVVSRGQMAVFIARARGWVALDDDMTTAPEVFPDVPAGYWSGTAIQACKDHGAVQGYDDGTYRPEQPVDRGQMAVYIARAFGLGE
jgi:hypothetical protein